MCVQRPQAIKLDYLFVFVMFSGCLVNVADMDDWKLNMMPVVRLERANTRL